MLPTLLRALIAGAVLVAATACATVTTAAPLPDPPMPAPLAQHQWHPAEVGFLNDLAQLDTQRSTADLVRLAQATCRAIQEDGATRADLRPAVTSWAEINDADADRVLTAASGNLRESAVLLDR